MTPNSAVILEKCTNRADFVHFTVEIQGLVQTGWSSNYVKFTTTNSILRMPDFDPILPGPCVMAVKSSCADGEESAISLFKLDIRRDAPKPPKAHVVSTGAPPFRNSLSNVFRSRRVTGGQPPSPAVLMRPNVTNVFGQPLPGGKPETYSDGVISMQQKFYAEHLGRNH
jgi:hypothetical protein